MNFRSHDGNINNKQIMIGFSRLDFSFTFQLFLLNPFTNCQAFLSAQRGKILMLWIWNSPRQVRWWRSQQNSLVLISACTVCSGKNISIWKTTSKQFESIHIFLCVCSHMSFQHISSNFNIFSFELKKAQTRPVTSTISTSQLEHAEISGHKRP